VTCIANFSQVKEECIASLTEDKLSSAAAIDILQLRLIASSQEASLIVFNSNFNGSSFLR
jgi:hypothetical protein